MCTIHFQYVRRHKSIVIGVGRYSPYKNLFPLIRCVVHLIKPVLEYKKVTQILYPHYCNKIEISYFRQV